MPENNPEVPFAAGEGVAAKSAPRIPIYEGIAATRAGGYSWDEIGQHMQAGRQTALDGGYTDEEINAKLGFKDPAEMKQRVRDYVHQRSGVPERPTVQDAVRAAGKGFGEGYGDEPLYQPSDTEVDRALAVVPFVGRLFGGVTGAAGAVAGRVAAAFGADDTESEQIKQAAKQMGDAAFMHAGSSVHMDPGVPKPLAKAYSEGLADGSLRSPEDMGNHIAREVLKTRPVGPDGEYSKVDVAAASAVGQEAATKFPDIADLTDGALRILGEHGRMGEALHTVANVKKNLSEWWAETGQNIMDAAQRADEDPVFRAKMLGDPHPDVVPGSARAKDAYGDFVVNRQPSDFDGAVKTVLKLEGGLTTDTGGLTNYGISKKAFPNLSDAEIRAMTPERATELYKTHYWDAIGADKLPENIRLTAFDAAVNEGVGKAKEMLRAAGNDADKFHELRREHYTKLAQDPQYAPYYKSWMKRLEATKPGGSPGDYAPVPAEPGADAPVSTAFHEFNDRDISARLADFETERFNLRLVEGLLPQEFHPLDQALKDATSERFDPERAIESAQWAKENDRADITQAIVDRAQNRLEEAQAKVDAAPAAEGEVKPAAMVEAQKLADEGRKTVDQLVKLAGREPMPEAKRQLVLPPEFFRKLRGEEPVEQAVPGKGGGKRGRTGQVTGQNPMGLSADPEASIRARLVGPTQKPGFFKRLADAGAAIYREMFNDNAPINQITNIVNGAREANGMSPLTSVNNPNFMRRLADVAPANHANIMLTKSMLIAERDATGAFTGRHVEAGPGLPDILQQPDGGERPDSFWTYALSKWGVEKADQGKETGLNLVDAKAVVAKYEANAGGTPPKIVSLMLAALNAGDYNGIAGPVQIHNVAKGRSVFMTQVGPHYQPGTHSIFMHDPTTFDYQKEFGESYDTVLSHEMGHAIAYKIGVPKGIPALKMTELADQLAIASRRFKPGLWEKWRKDTAHFQKDSELIADALATWAQDPAARPKLSALHDILGAKLDPFGKVEPAENFGTPMSRKFDALVDWQNGTLRYMRDMGVMSNEQFITSVADNAARIPGYRFFEDAADAAAGVKGAGKSKLAFNPVKGFEGSGLKVKNIMESLAGEAFLRTRVALNNLANTKLVDAAAQVQDLVTRIDDPKQPIELTAAEMKELTGSVTLPGKTSLDDRFVIYRDMHRQAKADEVPVLRDGKIEIYKFADEHVAPFLKGLTETQMSQVQRWQSYLGNITRSSIVLNPFFPVKISTLYDIPQQFLTKPFRNTVLDWFAGFARNSPEYDRWRTGPGAERVFNNMSADKWLTDQLRGVDDGTGQRVWNAIKSPVDALRAWSQLVGEQMRYGRFRRGLDAGEDETLAGMQSGEAALHRAGGGGPVSRNINTIMPFFTAHLKQMEITFRNQFGIGTRVTGEPYDWAAFSTKALAAITLPVLWNWASYKDDPRYKALHDWQKDNGLNFFVGDHHLFLPLPPVIGFMYGGLPRRLAERFIDDNPHAFEGMFGGAAGMFVPPGIGLSSNIFMPVLEHMANHSFHLDRPLQPGNPRERALPEYESTPYDTPLAKRLARMLGPVADTLNLSPRVIDNYIEQWGGSLGSAAVKTAGLILQQQGVLPSNPLPTTIEDWPLINSFLQRNPGMNSKPVQDFMTRFEHYERAHLSMLSLLKQGDTAGFQELLNRNPTEAAMHTYHLSRPTQALMGAGQVDTTPFAAALSRAQQGADRDSVNTILQADKSIKNMRQLVADIFVDKNKKPEQRAQEVDSIYSQAQAVAEGANKAMDKAGFK